MTACTNHGGKARRVVTAALVGVLSVGTVPMVALATEASDGVTPMFVTAEGAFENAKVNAITFSQGGVNVDTPSVDKDGDYQFNYERNHGVRLEAVELSVADGVTAHPDFTVDASDKDSQFDIQYFKRGADGKETGSALTGDVVDAGEYVIVITAKAGSEYGEGAIRIPFDINALDISSITLKGETKSVYDAEAKDITFWMDVDGDGTADQLYDPTDIEVKWVKTGADATEDNQYDSVVDSGTYKALVTAAEGSNYKGSVVLDSTPVEVKQLKLDGSDGNVLIPSIVSSSDALPTAADLDGIYIEGAFHGKDSAIMQELKLSLDDEDEVWYENGLYGFNVTKSDPNNENIDLKYDSINAHKVASIATWTYDGAPLSDHQEIVVTAKDGNFNDEKIVATDARGNKLNIVKTSVYDSEGNYLDNDDAWWNNPGDYTVLYRVVAPSDNSVGGQVIVNVRVWADAVDADASAKVTYDGHVVTSVSKTYDGKDVAKGIKLEVTAKDKDGKTVELKEGTDYAVSYYDVEGNQVREVINAGTYTMRLTSSTYKLSGTTEMTITVSPLALGAVTSNKLASTNFDVAGVGDYDYLPWREGGWAVKGEGDVEGLGLYYLDEDENEVWLVTDKLVNDVLRVVITNQGGEVVDKITDEGVYTLKFEARNADAENNYVLPADLEILCIESSHARFADVKWNDYFIDSVTWVSDFGRRYMTGYDNGLFGSYDKITRADVVGTLYKMAGGDNLVVNDWLYDTLVGWKSFDDVDGKQYYGRAIAWAKSAGIVNGHDGKFRPDETITREEFAAMLSNYAKKYGVYEAPSADALDGVADASSVSPWMTEAVSWAVENGIMGNAGSVWAQDEIVRADVAGMIWHFAS